MSLRSLAKSEVRRIVKGLRRGCLRTFTAYLALDEVGGTGRRSLIEPVISQKAHIVLVWGTFMGCYEKHEKLGLIKIDRTNPREFVYSFTEEGKIVESY